MRTTSLGWLRSVNVRTFLIYLLIIIVTVSIFLWHIRSQTIGLGPDEAQARAAAKLSAIWANPINAPYKLLQNGLYHSGMNHIFALRLSSAIVALTVAAAFFYVFRIWFGKPVAALGTVLFALTPLYLISGRLATDDIMWVTPVFLIAAYLYDSRADHTISRLIFLAALIVCLYTPGLIWLLVAGMIYWRHQLHEIIENYSTAQRSLILLIILILIAPLIHAFVETPHLIREWLLVGQPIPPLKTAAKNFAWGISALFFKAPLNYPHNIASIPLLNAAQIGLAFFGAYVVFERLRGVFYWLVGVSILLLALNSLNFKYSHLLILLPLLAFLSAMGLRYLFLEWRKVFPRNPLAKAFAIILMGLIVLIHLFYGVRFSLLAWPATQQVHSSYVLK